MPAPAGASATDRGAPIPKPRMNAASRTVQAAWRIIRRFRRGASAAPDPVPSGETVMRKLIVAAAGLAAVVLPTAASAQPGYYYPQQRPYAYGHNNREVAREMRECRRELRRADSRREYRQELRECRRELRRAERRSNRYGYGHRGW